MHPGKIRGSIRLYRAAVAFTDSLKTISVRMSCSSHPCASSAFLQPERDVKLPAYAFCQYDWPDRGF